jgi:hypothetical protein
MGEVEIKDQPKRRVVRMLPRNSDAFIPRVETYHRIALFQEL